MQTTKISGVLAGIVRQNAVARNCIRQIASPVNTNVDCKPPLEPPRCDKIYELRIYQMKPECYRDSIELMAKYWPVRTAYSKAIGSWMSELGGIAETVHLWEYDSLADRMAKRQKVAKDKKWTKEFWPAFFEKSHHLKTFLLAKSPGSTVNFNFCPNVPGLYELQKCEPYTPLVMNDCGEDVVGQFFTIYGPTPAEFILLRYTDPNKAFEKAYDRRKAELPTKPTCEVIDKPNWYSVVEKSVEGKDKFEWEYSTTSTSPQQMGKVKQRGRGVGTALTMLAQEK